MMRNLMPVIRGFIRSGPSPARRTMANFAEMMPTGDRKPSPAEVAPVDSEADRLFSRLEIELKGSDAAVLKSYSWFATTAAGHLDIEVGNCWASRKADKHRMTLLKSVHIYKKHRVQYEIRTHFRFMHFHKLTGSTMDTFLEYIERNLPEGVALKATKIEIEALPDHLKVPPPSQ